VDAADGIAYDSHDADDAVALGLLALGELDESSLWRAAAKRARERYASLDDHEFRRAAVHELIDLLVSDLVRTSSERIAQAAPTSAAEVLQQRELLVRLSDDLAPQQAELERLLFARVYRHAELLQKRNSASAALAAMFDLLVSEPARLPPKYAAFAARDGLPRAVADYLAGMTDRFALEECDRLTSAGR
jgi:dGTPase